MADIFGYARVSTTDQDPDAQRHGLTGAGAICTFDDVISGRTFERTGLTTLLDYARNGDVRCIVRLDRLGRSRFELLETVEMLEKRGIALSSLEERIDTTSAAGERIFHVFGAVAHFERSLIAERTRDGLQAAAANGRRQRRPPTWHRPGNPLSCHRRVDGGSHSILGNFTVVEPINQGASWI
jgi:DNA invertase Pin-like site-specific DNA recombinase